MDIPIKTRRRIWTRIQRSPGCWEWQGQRSVYGYGTLSIKGKNKQAHRVVMELVTGEPIPPGMIVMHTCDNPPCVNPDHLKIGTQLDNVWDMMEKGRDSKAPNPNRWRKLIGPKLNPGDFIIG
jgi:hypothetical protein